jgi:hypothetical protein
MKWGAFGSLGPSSVIAAAKRKLLFMGSKVKLTPCMHYLLLYTEEVRNNNKSADKFVAHSSNVTRSAHPS